MGGGGEFRATLHFDLKIAKGAIRIKEGQVEALIRRSVPESSLSAISHSKHPIKIIRRSNGVRSALLFCFSGSVVNHCL